MRQMFAIVAKEIKGYFSSPVGYFVIGLFLLFSGYRFYKNVILFQDYYQYYQFMAQQSQNPQIMEMLNLNSAVIYGLLMQMVIVLVFLIPAVTMRLFSEEKSTGTAELLMTAPLSVNQIVLGKFFGAFGFMILVVLPTVIYQILLFSFSSPELGPVLAGYGALIAFIAMGVAVGMFASSFTENQIIAMVVTLFTLLFLFFLGGAGSGQEEWFAKFVRYISIRDHVDNPMRGLIEVKDIVYFLSITVLFVFLTKQSVESIRWR